MKSFSILEAIKQINIQFPKIDTDAITLISYDGDSKNEFILQGSCNATYVNLHEGYYLDAYTNKGRQK